MRPSFCLPLMLSVRCCPPLLSASHLAPPPPPSSNNTNKPFARSKPSRASSPHAAAVSRLHTRTHILLIPPAAIENPHTLQFYARFSTLACLVPRDVPCMLTCFACPLCPIFPALLLGPCKCLLVFRPRTAVRFSVEQTLWGQRHTCALSSTALPPWEADACS